MTRARLDKRPGDVAAMFDQVASRYDLLNDVLSLGQDRYWRTMVARAVRAGPGELVLDLAAGTGTSSRAFITTGARCVACDFSFGMLRAGANRAGRPGRAGGDGAAGGGQALAFVAGDALDLPFADGAFDAVTISFGLRNVASAGAALAEMRRVTRPGGRLVVCEFAHLRPAALDAVYGRYLSRVLPAVAHVLSPNSGAYAYLAESIRAWPEQRELARQITAAGWDGVRWLNLSLGVVALHLARAPGRPGAGTGARELPGPRTD